MGQVSKDINNGLLCYECGQWMEDVWPDGKELNDKIFKNPPGHPRKCADCRKESANTDGCKKTCC
jgi:hypothetical protein